MVLILPYMNKTTRRLLAFKFSITNSTRFHSSFPSQHIQLRRLDTLITSIITALTSRNSILHSQSLHGLVIKYTNYNHAFLGDQLVTAYLNSGRYEDALKLFDEIPESDVVSWNSLISGFLRRGEMAFCLDVFLRMKCEVGVEPNEITIITLVSGFNDLKGDVCVGQYVHGFVVKVGLILEVKVVNALINLYRKFGCLSSSRRLFESARVRNLVTWNSIIAVYVQVKLGEDGVRCFVMLRRFGFMPDQATLVSLLQACESMGLRSLTEAVHGYIVKCGSNLNLTIATVMLNIYAKLGLLNSSCKVFEEMVDPDYVAWTAMLAAYAVHGNGREAIRVFEAMIRKGLLPDHVTFTHLLSACDHTGLVDEGKYYFRIMSEVYGIELRMDHYSCMVDLLGRSGLLNEAYGLIKSMAMEPNSAVWGALINACRVHGNVELGKEVAEKLFALDPLDSRNYLMLSNMYSAAGLWRDASNVRALMKDKNSIRHPGYSSFEHDNKIHRFVSGDQSHPEMQQIYKKLEEIIGKIRAAGLLSKTELVLHDVDEEVKEDMLNKHSEKLAIAFGLLVTKPGMPLIITKNLRTCGDCHETAKLVSFIEKREIIIRDTKRFHHFVNGLCSCRDYW